MGHAQVTWSMASKRVQETLAHLLIFIFLSLAFLPFLPLPSTPLPSASRSFSMLGKEPRTHVYKAIQTLAFGVSGFPGLLLVTLSLM